MQLPFPELFGLLAKAEVTVPRAPSVPGTALTGLGVCVRFLLLTVPLTCV